MAQGKLIVLEGIDGSGKSTQFKRLCARLEAESLPFHRIIFPRYGEASSALLTMYLNGAFGKNPQDVNAYAASTFYGVDRFASFRMDWGACYKAGGLILSDRYTTSNAVHQGAKVPEAGLGDFLDWLYDFEFRILELPRPDLVLYMDVDVETAGRQMRVRETETHTAADIHEADPDYLRRCLRAGGAAADRFGWWRIPCVAAGAMRPVEEIHGDIFCAVSELL
ncbi:MAG: thymidylate kinase [Firmicutes bacterium]|nr:thymidylate kinase [Bacillota bacterium]